MAKKNAAVPKFRIQHIAPAWVGKPDPCGHGRAFVVSDDLSYLHETAMKLQSRGHKVLCTERWDGAAYKQI